MTRPLGTAIPELGKSLKVYPHEILAGMLGIPKVGDIFYVDPAIGSNVTGAKNDPSSPFSTVYGAQAAMAADNDDVVVIASTSSTGRTTETAAINWNKRRTHLIGNGPARRINPRNGMGFGAGTSPCFTVSATNCSFTNISIASFEDNNILVDVTADYNTFNFVHFQGIGNDTTGDDAAARSLRLTGAGECEFSNCTIGLDTVTRSAANANLELTGSCARNKFTDCDFPMYADNAGAFWVIASTGNCTERFLKFERCSFMNPTTGSSTTITAGMDLAATSNGTIWFLDCNWEGATDLADDYTNLFSNIPVFDTANAGQIAQIAT